jgi:hypothetical protein
MKDFGGNSDPSPARAAGSGFKNTQTHVRKLRKIEGNSDPSRAKNHAFGISEKKILQDS